MSMESESVFVANQLQRICDGKPWYGDSVAKILDGVTANQAARRVGKAHTMWEIVKHVTGWAVVDRRRLQGENVREPAEGDWPRTGSNENEWQSDVGFLLKSIRDLSAACGKLTDRDLEQTLARGSNTYREQMHGALQHVVYHAAQLGMLKRSI